MSNNDLINLAAAIVTIFGIIGTIIAIVQVINANDPVKTRKWVGFSLAGVGFVSSIVTYYYLHNNTLAWISIGVLVIGIIISPELHNS